MRRTHFSAMLTQKLMVLVVPFIVVFAISASASGPSEKTIYNFQWGNDGASPSGNLVADSAGNLYGTTGAGGGATACGNGGTQVEGCGTIFELSPPAQSGGTWTETVLYRFQGGSDGSFPNSGLVLDSAGNLYGIATGNSTICVCDVIFKLSPQSGGTWTQSVLYTTNYPTNYEPIGTLALDSAGNLYGVTSPTNNCGTVFRLSPPAGGGTPWTETLIYQFPSTRNAYDVCGPIGALVLDKSGNVYGATQGVVGGATTGSVYRLKPPAITGQPWTISVLHDFTGGADGYQPEAGVIFHNGMNLYGTTFFGGANSAGTVFQLSPPSAGHTGWTKTTIFDFDASTSGQGPYGIVFDNAGNIYGATRFAVSGGGGEIFKLSPPSTQGGAWTETTLYSFGCSCYPTGVIRDKGIALYGLSGGGGTVNEGTAFAIIP
jgi:uncharacterized repeat protein (TIGR03803 family)